MTIAKKELPSKRIFTNFSRKAFGKLTSTSQSSLNTIHMIES